MKASRGHQLETIKVPVVNLTLTEAEAREIVGEAHPRDMYLYPGSTAPTKIWRLLPEHQHTIFEALRAVLGY